MEHDGGRDAEVFGEHGEFVSSAVAVGVFADADAVAAFSGRLELVRVVDRFANPQAAALIPIHRDRLAGEVVLGGEQFQLKTLRRRVMFSRIGRRERQLHFGQRFAAGRLVVGDFRTDIHVRERRRVGGDRRHRQRFEAARRRRRERRHDSRILAASPADPSFHQIDEPRIAEGPLIVSPSRVKDASLAVRADPGPWFAFAAVRLSALNAVFKHRAMPLVVLGVDIGFVPAFEAAKTFHDGMGRFGAFHAKHLATVPLELSPNQLDELRRIAKAERRAVQWHKALAFRDELKQRRFLVRGELIEVGVQYQAVVASQRLLLERDRRIIDIPQFDVSRGQRRGQLCEAISRPMMTVVPQKKQLKRGRSGRLWSGCLRRGCLKNRSLQNCGYESGGDKHRQRPRAKDGGGGCGWTESEGQAESQTGDERAHDRFPSSGTNADGVGAASFRLGRRRHPDVA